MFSKQFFVLIFLFSSTLAVPLLYNPLVRLPGLRIVGGNVTEIEKIPYIASLQRYGSHICGCNIISETFILTAAHCTSGSSANMFNVRVGSSYHTSGGQLIPVKSIHQHEKFDFRTIDFDYSILELESPIEFNDKTQPIKLPKQNENFEDSSMVVTSGWGNTLSVIESRDQLRTVEVPIVNQQECADSYFGFGEVSPRMICAGYREGGKDACQGDSGGPLAINRVNEDGTKASTIIGLTSWGYGCAKPNYPGVYSRVSYVADWIREISGIEY